MTLRTPAPTSSRRASRLPRAVAVAAAAVAAAGITACHDGLTDPRGDRSAAGAADGSPSAAASMHDATPVGIGGSRTITAGGERIISVPLGATGISIPAGIPVRVQVSGAITRTPTAGLAAFCALPRWAASCQTSWADIVSGAPIGPEGFASARPLVSMNGGGSSSPSGGSTVALETSSGGEVWFGRNGWGCYYSDTQNRLSGACHNFGGGWTVTVSPNDGGPPGDPSHPGGGDDQGGGAGRSLYATLVSSAPSGGGTQAVLAARAVGSETSGVRWRFIPDVVTTVNGDTTPAAAPPVAAYEVSSSSSGISRGRTIEAVSPGRWRLPDGRIVGDGLHIVRLSPDEEAQANTAREPIGAPAGVAALAAGGAISLSSCDDAMSCAATVPAATGTFVVTATIDGTTYAAQARLGSASAPPPPTLSFACTPGAVVRGATVECKATVSPAAPFRVVSAGAIAGTQGFQLPLVVFPMELPAGGTFSLAGPVALSSIVRVVADVKNTRGEWVRLPMAESQFTVQARSWEMRRPYDGRAVYAAATHTGASLGSPYITSFARIELELIRPSEIPAVLIGPGPNSGLAYVETEPRLREAIVYLNPELRAGRWFDDQNGGTDPESGRPRCTQELIGQLVANIMVHEAKHVGIELFGSQPAVQTIEALVSLGDADVIRRVGAQRWTEIHSTVLTPAHKGMDEVDRRNWLHDPYPCVWDQNWEDK